MRSKQTWWKALIAPLFSGWLGDGGNRYAHAPRDWSFGRLPASRLDWATEAGDLWKSSTVAVCLGWQQDRFGRALLQVAETLADGTVSPIAGHPMPELLRRPNPAYAGRVLWQATLLSYVVDGNAYWLVVKGRDGKPLEVWYAPHWTVEPVWPSDGSAFVTGHKYQPDGASERLIPLDDPDLAVVHFRDGLDPQQPRLGLSRLKAAAREVAAVNESATWIVSTLRNLGLGVVISPADPNVEIDSDGAKLIKQQFRASTRGDNRGDVITLTAPMKLDTYGTSPEAVALDKIHALPEAVVCSALSVPPMVVGLASGNATKTYANYEEATRAAWDALACKQDALADDLDLQLLPLYGAEESARLSVVWDRTQIPALNRDLTTLADALVKLRKERILTVNECRELLSREPVEDGDELEVEVETESDPAAAGPGAEVDPEVEAETEPEDDLPAAEVRRLNTFPWPQERWA